MKKILLSFIMVLILLSFSIILKAQSNTKGVSAIVDFPYVEDFESDGNIPENWSQSASNDHDWIFNASDGVGAFEGSYFAKFDHETTGDLGMLISPVLDLMGLTSPKLTFWHSQQAYGSDQDELRVYYRGTVMDPWTLIPGAEWTDDISGWTQETFILPTPNSTYQIAFEATDDYGYSVRLDYIVISEEICAEPSNLTITNLTESAADLSWDANGSETTWNLIISATEVEDFESASIIEIVGMPEYDILGMLSNTTYYIYIQTECAVGDESDWIETTVHTDCEWYVDLPIDEDFDGNWDNWCWRIIDNDGDGNTWTQGSNHMFPHSGLWAADGAGNQDDYLILPKLHLVENNVIKWYDFNEHATEWNSYDVLISTTNSDLSSFTTTLGSYDCDNNEWDQKMISLSDYIGQDVYIAFHQTYSHSLVWGFGIDDIRVEFASEIENKNTDNDCKVYPNPTNGFVNISANFANSEVLEVSIYNTLGQQVQLYNFGKANELNENFDLGDLAQGVYTIRVHHGNDVQQKKLVVQ